MDTTVSIFSMLHRHVATLCYMHCTRDIHFRYWHNGRTLATDYWGMLRTHVVSWGGNTGRTGLYLQQLEISAVGYFVTKCFPSVSLQVSVSFMSNTAVTADTRDLWHTHTHTHTHFGICCHVCCNIHLMIAKTAETCSTWRRAQCTKSF